MIDECQREFGCALFLFFFFAHTSTPCFSIASVASPRIKESCPSFLRRYWMFCVELVLDCWYNIPLGFE